MGEGTLNAATEMEIPWTNHSMPGHSGRDIWHNPILLVKPPVIWC